MSDELIAKAAQAYVAGFPLVFDLEQVQRCVTTGFGALPAAPFNSFSHARTLASAEDTFVTINNDTVYSMAQLDLSGGPIRLHVPDTDGRYYVLQFVDAWTNNFAYVGTRGTGDAAGDFVLVPPTWAGEDAFGDATTIRLPTNVASIVGRWACTGADDLPEVHALQDATTLTPISPQGETVGLATGSTTTDASEALAFFENFRVWSQAFPPAPRDQALLASFEPLGLTGDTPMTELPAGVTAALEAGFAQASEQLVALLRSGAGSPKVNYWAMTLHVFDYNLDFFEVGTIDADEWKVTDPEVRLFLRAAAALGGLWGNHGYEAAYLMNYQDADGAQLNGANAYELRLDPPPPVGAFWSLTMYDVPDFFLVPNVIDRYSIGDRTPGIVPDADGGFTITMSVAEPEDAKARANWLPTPAGDFRPILRMYLPEPAVFNGTWEVPAISKTS